MKKLSKKNESNIEDLRTEYRILIVKALSDKINYFDLIKKANSVLGKISVIKKKAELKARYGKENGFSDGFNKIIE